MDPPMSDDHHFRREDRTARWQRIAGHLAEHPEDTEIALQNIERWLSWGRIHPGPALEWRRIILEAKTSPEAWRSFLDDLARPDHDSNRLKSCSPFVGLPLEAGSAQK